VLSDVLNSGHSGACSQAAQHPVSAAGCGSRTLTDSQNTTVAC